jgi:hypothetical protein
LTGHARCIVVSDAGTPVHLKPYTHALVLLLQSRFTLHSAPASSTQPTTRVFKRTTSRPLGVLSTNARPVRTFCPKAYSSLQKGGDPAAGSPTATLLRLRPSHRARLRPLRPLRVRSRTSGTPGSHGVTGGVYKARERIHRGVADPRLLAIPASCSRVTDCNPNLDRLFPIRSASRHRSGLYRPL